MKFYVLTDQKMVYRRSEEEAKRLAECLCKDSDYVEYGVTGFDGWFGCMTIAILKNINGGIYYEPRIKVETNRIQ